MQLGNLYYFKEMVEGNLDSFCDGNIEMSGGREDRRNSYAKSLTLLVYIGMIQCLSIKTVTRL